MYSFANCQYYVSGSFCPYLMFSQKNPLFPRSITSRWLLVLEASRWIGFFSLKNIFFRSVPIYSSSKTVPSSQKCIQIYFSLKIISKDTSDTWSSCPKTVDRYMHPSGTEGVLKMFCSKWPFSRNWKKLMKSFFEFLFFYYFR